MYSRANPLMDCKVVGVSGYLFVYLVVYLPIYLSISQFVYFWYLSIYPSTYQSICLSVYLFVYLQTWKQNGVHFRHLNFQKCSENELLLDCFAHLTKRLCTCRFSVPSFRSFRATNKTMFHGFSTFITFVRVDLLASSFLFSDSSHLCFAICLYCRKFDF